MPSFQVDLLITYSMCGNGNFKTSLRGCLHVKLHSGMKLVPDEIIPVYGEMSLTVYTFFCRDEISSRDELIPVKKTRMKFHLGMKKRKKDV